LADTLDYSDFKNFLTELSDAVLHAKVEFDSMDAACGDGDFGSTMATAFGRVAKTLGEASGNDVGSILTLAGTSILSSAGGASGPTFASFFTEAGKTAKGKNEVDLQILATMLEKSLQKIRLLGGAVVGDKTMIDALEPAVNAVKEAANAGTSLHSALDRAAEAAKIGSESTKHLIAKHGRARYLGEQTLGHVDPGAYLISLTFATLAATKRS
jgi:dihydroxyacetone kinase-like protein